MTLDEVATKLFRKGVRFVSYFALNAYFNRPEVRNLDRLDGPGPKIIAANHMGDMFDPMLLWTYAGHKVDGRIAFPAKKELFEPSVPLLGLNRKIFRTFGCIPVDRKNPGNVIDEFVKALENDGKYDGVLSIHFEGTTTPKGELVTKAKTGFARAALRLPSEHCPQVIPASMCYIGGIYHALPGFRAHAIGELLEPVDVRPYKERYDRLAGHESAQHVVAEELTNDVRDRIIEDLKKKGVKSAPGIEGIY